MNRSDRPYARAFHRPGRDLLGAAALVFLLARPWGPDLASAQEPTPGPLPPAPAPEQAPPPPAYPPATYQPPSGPAYPPGYHPPPPGSAYPPGYQPPPGPAYPPGYQSPPPGPTAAGYPPGLYAQPSWPPPVVTPSPGARMHDGLFLRMQLGGSAILLAPAPDVAMRGAGSAVDLTLGGAISQRLVVGAALTHAAGGVAAEGAFAPDLITILVGFGPAVVFYLPGELFLGASAGGGMVHLRHSRDGGGETTWRTKLGLLAKLEAGKEWWVSDNWALGFSLRVQYLRAQEADAGPFAPVWSGGSLAALFSATYN